MPAFAPTSADAFVTARRQAYVNSAQVAALVGARVYDTQLPEGLVATFPYITLGAMTEADALAFGSGGNEVTFTDHLWGQGAKVGGVIQRAHSGLVLPLWKWAKQALADLDGLEITPGTRIVEISATLAQLAVDPSNLTIMHGIVLGRVTTEVA